jgi:glycosyltransferase involved in cell wall biosynthesis
VLNTERAYVFADPFGRADSGVSSYVANATNLLARHGLRADVVARRPTEALTTYRHRLAKAVVDIRKSHRSIVVEAPESDAATADIPSGAAEIHIRLHCSRQLGAYIQGERICTESLALEQREIRRSARISAPSRSAVIASRAIFEMREDICYYPNPAPVWAEEKMANTSGVRAHVVFVGRFHALKGAHWVHEMAKRLPDVSFLMVGPTPDTHSAITSLSNIRVVNGNVWSKPDIYAQAKLVIIPSLYETASMVGIEALSAGVPVIAWSHLGIAEYAPAPMVLLVEPYQLDEFSDAIRKVVQAPSTMVSASPASTINDLYLRGFHATLNSGHGNFMPVALPKERVAEISSRIGNPKEFFSMLASTPEPRFGRKLLKLRRDPIRFFNDSWIARLVIPPGKEAKAVRLRSRQPKTLFSGEEAKSDQLPMPTAKPLPVKPSPPKLNQFANINVNERIEFQEPPKKPEGLITAFLYPENRKETAQEIIAGLSIYEDFSYVRKPLLQIGTFQETGDADAVQLVERIDLKNKQKISAVDHLLLLDPPPVLVEGLRSCGTSQRSIVILDAKETTSPDPWHTDVLIVVGKDHPAAAKQGWRRKIVIRERANLPLAIRRAIQEGTPKSPDMLLPILGFDGYHRDELLETDTCFHQGVILARPGKAAARLQASSTMAEICPELALNMTDFAVAESVYLRYRTLCDRIEDVEARAQLLSYSLYDGVMFDVRT